jgi:hypothetical protein
VKPEGINVTRKRDLKKQLRLGNERISGTMFRKTVELKIAKQIIGTSIRLRKMSVRVSSL